MYLEYDKCDVFQSKIYYLRGGDERIKPARETKKNEPRADLPPRKTTGSNLEYPTSQASRFRCESLLVSRSGIKLARTYYRSYLQTDQFIGAGCKVRSNTADMRLFNKGVCQVGFSCVLSSAAFSMTNSVWAAILGVRVRIVVRATSVFS